MMAAQDRLYFNLIPDNTPWDTCPWDTYKKVMKNHFPLHIFIVASCMFSNLNKMFHLFQAYQYKSIVMFKNLFTDLVLLPFSQLVANLSEMKSHSFFMCSCREPHQTHRDTCIKTISIFLLIIYISFVFNHLNAIL